ncbi:MAG TPA: hypothetical protein PKI14_14240, partial [Fervidobacterium sp.]|nr:hypothetical protein [Fervidobacterium sp.]
MAELSSTNVYGNLTISGLLKGTYLRLSQANGGNESASLIELGNRKSNWTYGINFNAYYDGSWKYRSSDYGASIGLNNDGSLVMYVNASGTADSAFSWSNATYIKLLNNGNVGINKNPLYKLDVEGDVNIASSSKYKINGTNLNVVAGNGLTGGGDFAPGATITLGTPGTLTSTTTNAVTTSSHTHSISGFAKDPHALVSSTHTASGLTVGHFLKATSATEFNFVAHGLTAADVGAAAEVHNHGTGTIGKLPKWSNTS